MKNILEEIVEERARQDRLWGEQNHDPFKYLSILVEEVGEVGKALCDGVNLNRKEVRFKTAGDSRMYRDELIEVAAVAVAMVECLDRKKWCGK